MSRLFSLVKALNVIISILLCCPALHSQNGADQPAVKTGRRTISIPEIRVDPESFLLPMLDEIAANSLDDGWMSLGKDYYMVDFHKTEDEGAKLGITITKCESYITEYPRHYPKVDLIGFLNIRGIDFLISSKNLPDGFKYDIGMKRKKIIVETLDLVQVDGNQGWNYRLLEDGRCVLRSFQRVW